jgi:arylamine N-acetyltransferase
MKRTIKVFAPWLAAAAVGGALVLAPVASAAPGHVAPSPSHGTPSVSAVDPDVPFGTDAPGDYVPYDPYIKNPGGGVDLAS